MKGMFNDTLTDIVERVFRLVSAFTAAVSPIVGGLWWWRVRKAKIAKEEADSMTAEATTQKVLADVRKIESDITTQAFNNLITLVNELQEELREVRLALATERTQRVTERNETDKNIQQLRYRISASEYKNDRFQKGIYILMEQLKSHNITPAWDPSHIEERA